MRHSSYVTSLFSSRACCEEVLQPTLLTRKLSFGESESLVEAAQPVSEVGPHPALNLWRLLMVLTKNWSTPKPTSPSAQSSNRCLPPPRAPSSPVATVCSGSDRPASFFQKGVCVTVRPLLFVAVNPNSPKVRVAHSCIKYWLSASFQPCARAKGREQTHMVSALKLRVELSANEMEGQVWDVTAAPNVGWELSLGSRRRSRSHLADEDRRAHRG